MLKYLGSSLIRSGFLGVVLIILVIAVGLQPERLLTWATSIKHQALFTEAGGIMVGNDVTLSGMKIGSVTDVSLENGDALIKIDGAGLHDIARQLAALEARKAVSDFLQALFKLG